MQEKNIELQIEELKVKAEAGDAESAYTIGNIYHEHFSNLEVAIFWYKKAIELKPNYASAYNNLGIAYKKLEDYNKAIDCYTKSIELNPNYWPTYYNLGLSYFYLGEFSLSKEQFIKSLELNNEYYYTYYNLGLACNELKEYETAIHFYEKALLLKPQAYYSKLNMANAFASISNNEKAINIYLELINESPQAYESYYNLGLLYFGINEYKKSIKYLKKASKINRDINDIPLTLGLSYIEVQKFNFALVCFEKAIEIEPNDYRAYNNIGLVYLKTEKYQDAIFYFKKSISLNPDSTKPFINLSQIYLNIEQHDLAIKILKQCKRLFTNNADIYYNLGVCYQYYKNDSKKAALYYKRAIKLDPNFEDAYIELIDLHLESNEIETVKKIALKALEKFPNNSPTFFIALGLAHYEENDYETAFIYLKKALKIDPKNTQTLTWLGVLYSDIKEPIKAISYLKKGIGLDDFVCSLLYARYFYDLPEIVTFDDAANCLKNIIEKFEEPEAYFEFGKLYLVKDHLNEELALKYLLKAKEFGFDCEYEIKQIKNNYDNEFINGIKEFTKTNSPSDMNAIREFTKKYVGDELELLNDYSKEMILRCVGTYMYETVMGFQIEDYSNTIINLAIAIEKELDIRLGLQLKKFILEKGIKGEMAESISSRKKARTLGEYEYMFSTQKNRRLLDDNQLHFLLDKVFKPNVFGEINKEVNVTSYITNLVKEINKFSEYRNKAAHIKPISKEIAEAWLDKMLGSGNMLQNFLAKLRTN